MANHSIDSRIKSKIDTWNSWVYHDPILLAGEIGIVSDKNKFKVGDGSSIFTALPFVDSVFKLTNKSILTSAWVSNATYASFPYRATVPLFNVGMDDDVDIIFSLTDSMSGNFCPVCDSYGTADLTSPYDGGVYIYAAAIPASTITIPKIIIHKADPIP